MKLMNFKMLGTKGTSVSDKEFFAEVDVQSRFLFWKKITRRKIHRRFADFWYFADTGEYTPGLQAEKLARAYGAQNGFEV